MKYKFYIGTIAGSQIIMYKSETKVCDLCLAQAD